MELVERKLMCAKETVELGEGLAAFAIAMKEALADGWQMGADLPVGMTAAMQHLVPAVQGAEKIGDETANVEAFSNGIYVGISPIGFAFVKKPEPAPAA